MALKLEDFNFCPKRRRSNGSILGRQARMTPTFNSIVFHTPRGTQAPDSFKSETNNQEGFLNLQVISGSFWAWTTVTRRREEMMIILVDIRRRHQHHSKVVELTSHQLQISTLQQPSASSASAISRYMGWAV